MHAVLFQVYSKVILLYIHVYIFFSRFFSIIGYCKILDIVLCAMQWVLFVFLFYFVHSSMYLFISNS